MQDTAAAPTFTLAHVPGVIPDKWVRTWGRRYPDTPLELVQAPAIEADRLVRDGEVDAVLLRLPIDREGLHAIPLYTEKTVVVIPKDHFVAAADEVAPEELADEIVQHPLDDVLDWDGPPGRPAFERPATTGDAIQLVAAGVGLLVVPMSLARLHHRKDLTYRPLTGVPESTVALTWPEDGTTELMEQIIGIVRGRTPNSTRGRQQTEGPAKRTRKAGANSPQSGGKAGQGKDSGRKPGKPKPPARAPRPGKRGSRRR